MDRASVSPPASERSHDDDQKPALLLEYDTADFRGRHDLLEREGLTVRDIARWRRETAQLATTGEAVPPPPPRAPRPARKASPEPAADPADAEPEAGRRSSVSRRRRQSSTPDVAPPPPAAGPVTPGPLSALRSDVVAAHASAIVYHADALARLTSQAPSAAGYRRRTSPLDQLVEAAAAARAAAREVLSQRRRSGAGEAGLRDSVDVSSELNDMLTKLTDYSSLAIAVQLLARELAPSEVAEPGRTRRPVTGDRPRRPWWGVEEDAAGGPHAADPASQRTRHAWGANRKKSGEHSSGS